MAGSTSLNTVAIKPSAHLSQQGKANTPIAAKSQFCGRNVSVGQAKQPTGMGKAELATLHEHKATAEGLLARNRQPFFQLIEGDVKLFPIIAATENARHPELNLTYSASYEETIKIIEQIKNGDTCRILCQMSDGDESRHHMALDIRKQDNKISIISIDSANFESSPVLESLITFSEKIAQRFDGNVIHTTIATQAQKSPSDCGIFGLSNILKAYKHEDLFSTFHDQQFEGNHLTGLNIPPSKGTSILLDGYDYLPVDFLKHASSYKHTARYVERHPQEGQKVVNKKGETVVERQKKFEVERDDRTYSSSIEHKRISFLNRAIDYINSK